MRKLEIEECLNQIEFAANALEVILDQIICSSNSMNSEVLGQALYGLANTINSQVKKAMDLVFETSPDVGGGQEMRFPINLKISQCMSSVLKILISIWIDNGDGPKRLMVCQ